MINKSKPNKAENKNFNNNIIKLLENIRKDYSEGKSGVYNSVKNLAAISKKSINEQKKKILREFIESDLYKENKDSYELVKDELYGNGGEQKLEKCMGLYVTSPKFRKLVLLNVVNNEINVISILLSCYKIFVEKAENDQEQPESSPVMKNEVQNNIMEVAPPSEKIERFIKKNKKAFRERYGKDWERILYATAWKMYNKGVK